MMQGEWRRGVCGLAVLLMLAAGCQQKTKAPPSDGAASAEATGKPAEGPTTFPGKWALVVTQQMADQSGQPTFRDLHLMLFEIKEGADGPTAVVHSHLDEAPKFAIESIKIDGDQCTLELAAQDAH